LTRLAAAEALMAHRHEGFSPCMDTLKEAQDLNALCRRGAAPSCSSKRLQPEDRCHMDPGVLILLFRVADPRPGIPDPVLG
ncbi:MAG TPA: hypothetical protein VFZ10_12605, partial [Geminicoccaceae bacterium]